MTTLKNISGSSPRHFTLGNTRNRQIVQHKRHARKRIVLLPAALFAFSLAVPAAHSAVGKPSRFHGTICQPLKASRNFVDYNQYGIHNSSSTNTATVECPIFTECRISAALAG